MLLYHGTTERIARVALAEGLRPRAQTGVAGNWTVASNPEIVYLTNAYAGYFAMQASSGLAERWGIVEVDTDALDESLMRPDEDFLEQTTRGYRAPAEWGLNRLRSMKSRTLWFRKHVDRFSDLWRTSLDGLGTAGYAGAIPPEAISRVCVFDPKGSPVVTAGWTDPDIGLNNYRYCGDKYRALTALFFAESPDAAETLGLRVRWDLQLQALQEETTEARERRETIVSMFRDRSAFSVLQRAA